MMLTASGMTLAGAVEERICQVGERDMMIMMRRFDQRDEVLRLLDSKRTDPEALFILLVTRTD